MAKWRTSLSLFWAGIVMLLFLSSAISLRFAPATDTGAPPAQDFTAYMLSLTARLSARELAWAVLMAIGLWRREIRLIAFLLIMRALSEAQDIATLTVNIFQGRAESAMFGVVGGVLVLIILHLLAARALLGRTSA